MEAVLEQLRAEMIKYQGFAEHWKSRGETYKSSYYLNIRYADGIEHAIGKIERELEKDKDE